MKLERSLKLRQVYEHRLLNLYDNALRFRLPQEEILEARNDHVFDATYHRLPQWVHMYLQGFEKALRMHLEKNLVYSYEVNGKRLTIDSAAYQKVSPVYVSKHCSHTGAFVYRGSTNIYAKQRNVRP